VISGTPTTAGTSNFTIQLTDANLATTTQALSITVNGTGMTCAVTPTGNNVVVMPSASLTISYPIVSVSGNTCLSQTGSGPTAPTGYQFGAPATYSDITTTATFSGNAQLCFNYDQTHYKAESTLKLFHWNGATWDNVTTSLNTVTNTICGNAVTFTPSLFAIGGEAPTAITLSDFRVDRSGSDAVIHWTTSSETDNWGFRILRSESSKGPFRPINARLIPAHGGPGLSISYRYTDRQALLGKSYYYRLEDISTQGLVTAHNTIQLRDAPRTALAANTRSSQPLASGVSHSSSIQPGNPVANAAAPIAAPTTAGTLILPGTATRQHPPTVQTPIRQDVESVAETSPPVFRPVAAAAFAYNGADPAYAHGAPSATPPQLSDTPASTDFSAAIRDAHGRVIEVSRLAENKKVINPTELKISREQGYPHIHWQVKDLVARGFKVLRSLQGQNHYQPVVDFVPNYGEGDHGVYEYAFTDHSAQQGRHYDYRLEIITWGIQTAAVH